MNQKEEFSKWISVIENALSNKTATNFEESMPTCECDCGNWECKSCFPSDSQEFPDSDEEILQLYPESNVVVDFEESGSCGGMGAGGMAQVDEEDFFGDSDGQQSPLTYGGEIEENKPTKTKDRHYLDDLDDTDILNSRKADLPIEYEPEDFGDVEPENEPAHLPTASRATTQDRLRNITPSDVMRDYMSRIDPNAGADEPAIPDAPQNELVIRTASDVPAVVSSAMRAAGTQSPEWHTINNLPGYRQQNIRGMGRQIFGMFTSTPLENIKTIANVNGQGPNTNEEIRAVAAFLRDNAEDLGEVDMDYGAAIPGYRPDVKEYKANGIRFQVVRDPMGQYIYAYPDADARIQGNQDQTQTRLGRNRNMPRLTESILKPTLFEQIVWDEEINQIFKQIRIDEAFGKPSAEERDARRQAGYKKRLDAYNKAKTAAKQAGTDFDEEPPKPPVEKATLARRIGSQPGGRNLVKWLHGMHKLSNEAELEPVLYSKRVFWSEFKSHPDDFVIVAAERGVAGIKPSLEYYNWRKAYKEKKGEKFSPGNDGTMQFQVIAFTDDGKQIDSSLFKKKEKDNEKEDEFATDDPTVIKARMGLHNGIDRQNRDNVFELLKDQIGAPIAIYVSGFENKLNSETPKGSSVERDKMAKRAELGKEAILPEKEAILQVFNKVQPVLAKLAHQASSHITRSIKRYIDGGNYEGAKKLTGSAEKIKEFLTFLDTNQGITMTHRADDTHEQKFARNEFWKTIILSVENASGARRGQPEFEKWISKAARGSNAELKPILDALREKFANLS